MRTANRARALTIALAALTAWCTTACEDKVPEPAPAPKASAQPPKPKKTPPEELVKDDEKVGEGPTAETGDTVKVHYTGRLFQNGKKFDSSRDRDQPFEFTLGKGQVIKGWDQGVVGMKVGGKRKLTIPAELGYGDRGSPPKIPGGAALVFDVELVEVVGKDAEDGAGGG